MQQMGQGGGIPGMPGMFGGGGMGNPQSAGNRPPAPGWRGHNTGIDPKKKKKDKKKKGFGNL